MIFCGSGSTAAVNRLVDVLNLRIPADLDDRYDLRCADPARAAAGRVHRAVRAPLQRAAVARVDRRRRHDPRGPRRPRRPGPAARGARAIRRSAAEDRVVLRGIERDRHRVRHLRDLADLSTEHGALSFWDFAAAAPYVTIEMDPPRSRPARLQGRDLHLAPQVHRRAGDPGRAGRAPGAVPEPGAVDAGRRHGPVRQPVRARLPVRHRAPRGGRHPRDRRVDPGRARVRAQGGGGGRGDPRPGALVHPAGDPALGGEPVDRDPGQPRGGPAVDRLVRRPARRNQYLHHNFVVALLNDLFGIQSRGGCSCAGPYGHRLLGIDLETSHEFEREITRGCEGIKPGWVRVNFNYFISEAVFEFILDAVGPRRDRRLAAARRLRVRAGDRAVDAPRRPAGAARVAAATSPTTATAWPGRRTGTTSPSRGSPITSSRAGRSWTGRP